MVVLGGGAFSYERGTPVCGLLKHRRVGSPESRAGWALAESGLLGEVHLDAISSQWLSARRESLRPWLRAKLQARAT